FKVALLFNHLLFPYTTLFRSRDLHISIVAKDTVGAGVGHREAGWPSLFGQGEVIVLADVVGGPHQLVIHAEALGTRGIKIKLDRSEEHTSELQSRENLVCRLL